MMKKLFKCADEKEPRAHDHLRQWQKSNNDFNHDDDDDDDDDDNNNVDDDDDYDNDHGAVHDDDDDHDNDNGDDYDDDDDNDNHDSYCPNKLTCQYYPASPVLREPSIIQFLHCQTLVIT